MLLLNAGHKPVSTKHQLELIFLGILGDSNALQQFLHYNGDQSNIKIYKEKDISSITYAKKRNVGEFHLSHIITSFLSFNSGKPITITSNKISTLHDSFMNDDFYIESSQLREFITFLIKLDQKLYDVFGQEGVKWIAKETVLNGISAAIGCACDSIFMDDPKYFVEHIDKNLNISSFEQARKNIDISKVNIGSIMKTAVFDAISRYIMDHQLINWNSAFTSKSKPHA